MTHSASLMGRGFCVLVTMAIVALTTDPATAQAVDEVELVDGGMVRGTLVEVAPGQKVVLQVPGEPHPRTIPWARVRDVKQGESAPLDEVEVAPEGDIFLHVETENPDVEVHSVQSTTVGYVGDQAMLAVQTKLECHAPCDRKLPSGRYFFAGQGVTPSQGFVLDARWNRAEAGVEAGSATLAVGGWWMGSLGLAGASTGAVFIALGYALDDDRVGSESYADYRTAGFVTLGVGSALLVGGIIMLVQSATDFELRPETTSFAGLDIPTGRFAF